MTEAAPIAVSRFEAQVLRLARLVFGSGSFEKTSDALWNAFTAEPLSPVGRELLKDTLRKGTMLFLARAGGWRRARTMEGIEGRLWERHAPEARALRFTKHSSETLVILSGWRPHDWAEKLPRSPGSPADQLFIALLYHVLRADKELARHFRMSPVAQDNRLLRLFFPEDWIDLAPPRGDWSPWFIGEGALILDGLQERLAQRWIAVERRLGTLKSWDALLQAGQAHGAILDGFLAAARAADRPDLARFLLIAHRRLFDGKELPVGFWTGGLQGDPPRRLAERLAAIREAIAGPRRIETLAAWTTEFRNVPFHDEGYNLAQGWLAIWEREGGDSLRVQAQRLLRETEPLRAGSRPTTGEEA